MTADQPAVYTVRQVAAALQVSQQRVYSLLQRGWLQRAWLGRPARITAESLQRLTGRPADIPPGSAPSGEPVAWIDGEGRLVLDLTQLGAALAALLIPPQPRRGGQEARYEGPRPSGPRSTTDETAIRPLPEDVGRRARNRRAS